MAQQYIKNALLSFHISSCYAKALKYQVVHTAYRTDEETNLWCHINAGMLFLLFLWCDFCKVIELNWTQYCLLLHSAEVTILACNQTTRGNCLFCRKLLICLRPEYGTASRRGMQVDRRDGWPVLEAGWRGEFRTPCGFHTAWYNVIPVGSICNACFHNTNPLSQGSQSYVQANLCNSRNSTYISCYIIHTLCAVQCSLQLR